MSDDERFMARALRLAAKGRGSVEPNPMVGAVLVKHSRVVGEGYHRRFGGPHAEVNAIALAGRRTRGSTLYVTLAPCGHYGKTPPCVDAVVAAGIRRVVIAMDDPNPVARARWRRAFSRAKINTTLGILEEEARYLNRAYVKYTTKGVPFVTAKWAMTLDGKIAAAGGDSRWVSSETSRRYAHFLRHLSDAVVVGIGTALRDDPELTCRIPRGRTPLRVVLDSRARLPRASVLARTAKRHPVLVACTRAASSRKVSALSRAGCEVVRLPESGGRVRLPALMRHLGKRGITHVLIEGGSAVLGAAFDERVVDRVVVFVSPRIAGGARAVTPTGGRGIAKMTDALSLENVTVRRSGGDVIVEGDLCRRNRRG